MELGVGFAFVGSQYHFEVGGQDFYELQNTLLNQIKSSLPTIEELEDVLETVSVEATDEE